jgi:UDP-N-acetylmuramoyl-tripeptide--D-alanyl-D-alanine ligase
VTPLWTAAEVREATHGTGAGEWQASGVSIDTRSLQPGDLFIALTGSQSDGHRYLAQAAEKGAVAAIVSQEVASPLPSIRVPDTEKALWALGVAARARTQATILAVTGSVGKTTAKEMLRAAFAAYGTTYATGGNFNNHLGAPLSLARMPRDTEYGIFELGMNHAGELAALTRLVTPHVAMITTVAAAHLEHFASEAAIADAKAEIFEGLSRKQVSGFRIQAQGIALIPSDNPHTPRLREAATHHATRIAAFGRSGDTDMQVVGTVPEGERLRVSLHLKHTSPPLPIPPPQAGEGTGCSITPHDQHLFTGEAFPPVPSPAERGRLEAVPPREEVTHNWQLTTGNYSLSLPSLAEHWADLAALTLLAVTSLHLPPAPAMAALETMPVPEGRGGWRTATINGASIRVMDDSYNANPASMAAALCTFARTPVTGRRIALLGDMLELGPGAPRFHRELAAVIAPLPLDLVGSSGPLMRHLHDALPEGLRGPHAETPETLWERLQPQLRAGDALLIKGSHGSGMYRLVKGLS